MNITPKIRKAIERSGGEPLRLEDSAVRRRIRPTAVIQLAPAKVAQEEGFPEPPRRI